MNFYEFASNSPILTFFLFLIIGTTLAEIASAVFKKEIMRYLKAYFKAWSILFGVAVVVLGLRWVFVGFESLLVGYVLYLVSTSAVGGVLREGIKAK